MEANWISVKDRLPDNGTSVLTYPHYKVLSFGKDNEGFGIENTFTEWSDYYEETVNAEPTPTHWMPLPSPPVENDFKGNSNSEFVKNLEVKYETVTGE